MKDRSISYSVLPRRLYRNTWVSSVPKKYWRNFLQLWMEGVNSFYPAPNNKSRFAYWRMNDELVELLYQKEDSKIYKDYARKILSKDLSEIVTKKDWDKRISKILSEKH